MACVTSLLGTSLVVRTFFPSFFFLFCFIILACFSLFVCYHLFFFFFLCVYILIFEVHARGVFVLPMSCKLDGCESRWRFLPSFFFLREFSLHSVYFSFALLFFFFIACLSENRVEKRGYKHSLRYIYI